MPRLAQRLDWQTIVEDRADDGPVANTASRLRWVMGLFIAVAAAILARAVQLEISDGANFRHLAAQPVVRQLPLPARRGAILDRQGRVLAADRMARAVAVDYRYLEEPSDAAWLRRLARARLAKPQRRDRQRLAESEQRLRDELADLHRRLAKLVGIDERAWQARVARVERRVKALAAHVNARRLENFEEQLLAEDASSDISLAALVAGLFAPPERLPPAPMVVAEQRACHPILDDVSAEVVAEIQDHPERWPGVKIVEHLRREYPQGSLAANLLGHVGVSHDDASGSRGLMGFEHRFDQRLAGLAGLETRHLDRRGHLLASRHTREPADGQPLTLSLDARLQQAAETWLDRRTQPSATRGADQPSSASGGAIVVLDVHTGEVLAAASSPRFDPNWFAAADPRVEAVLADSRQPLFDRATKMAITPGSAFKPLTAMALVESRAVDPTESFRCQGYLDDPDRLRCQIYRQHGVGHGAVTLAEALAQSCNVYFFHHAPAVGGPALADWARRFGFGQRSAAEIDDEAPGNVPDDSTLRSLGATQQLAIGQGALAVTPLQMARFYAAIANGGRLVTPTFVKESADPPPGEASVQVSTSGESTESRLSPATLDAVRDGLRRVVDDPRGTAHESVRLPWPAIAGKTGTAETGGDQADHAWFAGYAPAEEPRIAFVVVLEHGGSGAAVAGAMARQLVLQMRALGYFGEQPVAQKASAARD
jgi:penicillin-binding protein 2